MSAIPPPPPPPPVIQQPPAGFTKICKYCAMTVPNAANFCPHCRKRLGTHPLTMGCAVLFGLAVLLWFIGNSSRPISRPTSTPSNVTPPTAEEKKALERTLAEASALGQKQREAYLKTPAGKLNAQHPDWSQHTCDLIAKRQIVIGMTAEQVRAAWGKPYKINSTIMGRSTHEQWVMHESGSTYVYFEDGIMTSLQQSR